MTKSKQIPKSKLALAIEQRERDIHEFDVQGFFSLGDREVAKVGIRVNTKSEEDFSVVSAHKYVKAVSEGIEEAAQDMDLLNDSKAIEALFRACKEVNEDAEEGSRNKYAAFPGPKWMRENLTTDQIATLLNLYHEVRRRHAPTSWSIKVPDIMMYARAAARSSHTNFPDHFLAEKSPEWITQAFIILSGKFFGIVDALGEDKFDEYLSLKAEGEDGDVQSEDQGTEFEGSEGIDEQGEEAFGVDV